MRTSNAIIAFAVLAVLPVALLLGPGCVDPAACLRNSDCPAADICSVGACIPAPEEPGDGSSDGTLSEAASDAGAADATVSDGGAIDASGDAAKKDAATDGSRDGARDATGQ